MKRPTMKELLAVANDWKRPHSVRTAARIDLARLYGFRFKPEEQSSADPAT